MLNNFVTIFVAKENQSDSNIRKNDVKRDGNACLSIKVIIEATVSAKVMTMTVVTTIN